MACGVASKVAAVRRVEGQLRNDDGCAIMYLRYHLEIVLCCLFMSSHTAKPSTTAVMESLSRTLMVIQDLQNLEFVYIRLFLPRKRLPSVPHVLAAAHGQAPCT